MTSNTAAMIDGETLVPEKNSKFEAFGHFNDLMKITKSGIFYPSFVTGLSGNGKTHMIEQICAHLGREFVRVNFTIETDESDLLGSFHLKDGETVWEDGPVTMAMKRGAVLLLDEVDLASTRVMCLQPILEGKSVFLKKIGETVKPAPGFMIFATANTKGQGSETGKFVGTNVMNEAFLDRFAATFEQDYPPKAIELKILTHHMGKEEVAEDMKNKTLIEILVKWADQARKTYERGGGISEVISTRRLISLVQAYVMFGDIKKAMNICTSRFNIEDKNALVELFTKLVPVAGTTEGISYNEISAHELSTENPGRVLIVSFSDTSIKDVEVLRVIREITNNTIKETRAAIEGLKNGNTPIDLGIITSIFEYTQMAEKTSEIGKIVISKA